MHQRIQTLIFLDIFIFYNILKDIAEDEKLYAKLSHPEKFNTFSLFHPVLTAEDIPVRVRHVNLDTKHRLGLTAVFKSS